MSKLRRSELKGIVKECLIEILSEGLTSSLSNIQESAGYDFPTYEKQKVSSIPKRKKPSYLDNISFPNKDSKSIQEKKKSIKNKVLNSNLTSDPILNELLADTATTTLQEQVAAEGKGGMSNVMVGGDAAAKKMHESIPEDVFGTESAGKWAQLAFSK